MQKFNQSYRITTAHITCQSAKRINSQDDQPSTQAPCTRITLRTDSLLYESRLSPHSMGRSGTSKTPKYVRILLQSAFRTIFEISPTKSKFDRIRDSVLQVHGHARAIDGNSANRTKKFMHKYIAAQNSKQIYRITTAHIVSQNAKRPYS